MTTPFFHLLNHAANAFTQAIENGITDNRMTDI
jgi:hypothetical protein